LDVALPISFFGSRDLRLFLTMLLLWMYIIIAFNKPSAWLMII
jgi:hypothetical protein